MKKHQFTIEIDTSTKPELRKCQNNGIITKQCQNITRVRRNYVRRAK